MNLLVLDNFDSFTFTLVDYLRQAGAVCRVLRNNEPLSNLIGQAVDGVVLSPGPGRPRQAGGLMDVIAHYHDRVPMLGVCLGHQAIGEFFGASLTAASQPMHGKVTVVRKLADDVLLQYVPEQFAVTRYHSLLLTDLPPELINIAETDQGEIMALRHRNLPIWGVQFHPEAALTEYGLTLLKNWIDSIASTRIRTASAASLTVEYA